MSMVRMFHIACDAPKHYSVGGSDIGDEYFAATAIQQAKDEGYRISGSLAICPECYEAGYRFADCR